MKAILKYDVNYSREKFFKKGQLVYILYKSTYNGDTDKKKSPIVNCTCTIPCEAGFYEFPEFYLDILKYEDKVVNKKKESTNHIPEESKKVEIDFEQRRFDLFKDLVFSEGVDFGDAFNLSKEAINFYKNHLENE